jgi:hypothetical protein
MPGGRLRGGSQSDNGRASEALYSSVHRKGLASGRGGTGRRAGLKIRFWRQSVGSIPTARTNAILINLQLFLEYSGCGQCRPRWAIEAQAFDFRPGGRERLVGVWPGGETSAFDRLYYDIAPNDRIVYAYEMPVRDKRISASLATIEMVAQGASVQANRHRTGVFLDGEDGATGREQGLVDSSISWGHP